MQFEVSKLVYQPSEDTFLLEDCVKVVSVKLQELGCKKVLELGSGSGYITTALVDSFGEFEFLLVTDISPVAISTTRKNILKNKTVSIDNILFLCLDLFEGLQKKIKFDLIVFNPPYVPTSKEELESKDWEIRSWAGGKSGLEVIGRFLEALPDRIAEKGRALIIISSLNFTSLSSLEARYPKIKFKVLAEKKIPNEKLLCLEIHIKTRLCDKVSDPVFPRYLATPWKAEYVRGKKPATCVLCKIRDKDPETKAWEIYRDENAIVALNIFPYNPGHLLVFPKEHIIDYSSLDKRLLLHLNSLIQKCLKLLKVSHGVKNFNVGFNQGKLAGGSMEHLHIHVVPRFATELNFIDVLGTRILIETLDQTLEKIQAHIEVFGEEPIKEEV